jgi:hypothetical protein
MSSKYDDLEKLADLKNKSIITEEEFNKKKAQILNQDYDNTQDNVHEPIRGDNNETWQSIKQSPVVENKITNNVAKIIGTIINIIIFILIIVLVATNPTKADFQNYISNRIQKSSANTEDSSNKFFSALATLAVNQITERDNYFVCSLYTVNTTYFKMFSDKIPDNPKFLGIFGQFIPLNVSFKDKGENVGQKSEVVPAPAPAPSISTSSEYPLQRGAVNDFANIIDAENAAKMEALAREVLQKTGTAIVVVTVPTIGENEDYNFYANGLYKAWGIGKKGEDKGVLIFLTLKERKIRIETGYGVEGILPDGLVGEIRDKYLKPQLQAGNYGKAFYDTMYMLSSYIAKDANVQLEKSSR